MCAQLEVTLDVIASMSQGRNASLARSMIANFAHYHAKYSFIDIATMVCRDPPGISKTLLHPTESVTPTPLKHLPTSRLFSNTNLNFKMDSPTTNPLKTKSL